MPGHSWQHRNADKTLKVRTAIFLRFHVYFYVEILTCVLIYFLFFNFPAGGSLASSVFNCQKEQGQKHIYRTKLTKVKIISANILNTAFLLLTKNVYLYI